MENIHPVSIQGEVFTEVIGIFACKDIFITCERVSLKKNFG
jgi:hypothetical protein